MSGPKVVRVITREERVAACEHALARLEAVAQTWRDACQQPGFAERDEIKAYQKRHAEIGNLLKSDRFAELEEQAEREIGFIKADMERRYAKLAEKKAQEKSALRRLASTANTIQKSIEERGMVLTETMEDDLRRAAKGQMSVQSAEEIISRILNQLAVNNSDPSPFERQQALAQRLGNDHRVETLSDWVKNRSNAESDTLNQIDRHLSELELVAGEERAKAYAQRVQAVAAEPSPRRQQLLADSITVDLAAELRKERHEIEKRTRMAQLHAELSRIGDPAHSAVLQKASAILIADDLMIPDEIIAELEDALAKARSEQKREARRTAVLDALARLGYEVREGMETAWAENGNVVVKSAKRPNAGVKLSGGSDAGLLQLRPVRFQHDDSQPDTSQDTDLEALWCSDFNQLRTMMAATGDEAAIEAATPVGQVAVECVVGSGAASRSYETRRWRPRAATKYRTR